MVDAPGVWQMVKAIQELKAANDNLKDANARLEERVRALEVR